MLRTFKWKESICLAITEESVPKVLNSNNNESYLLLPVLQLTSQVSPESIAINDSPHV